MSSIARTKTSPPGSLFLSDIRGAIHMRQQGAYPSKRPVTEWEPLPEDILYFLTNTRDVHALVHRQLARIRHPSYQVFRDLDICALRDLDEDIHMVCDYHAVSPLSLAPGPSQPYVRELIDLSWNNPSSFLMHVYCIWFAHGTGTKSIVDQVSGRAELPRPLVATREPTLAQLQTLRTCMGVLSMHWTKETRARCLQEVDVAFDRVGEILCLMDK